jgi:crotonobetainyl-CoA:carnitine CoA-transferase CaiB-like acyl-CoA transferase
LPTLNIDKPLAGVKVLEITTAWAGPLVGRHLADMGADVFLIEPPRVQPTRGHHFPGGSDQIWPHFYNRGSAFNQLNRNKRGMMLDIRHPDGQAQVLEMVKNVDVVIENNSVHVMKDYGMGFAVLSKINPRLVMCSISGFGATGPHAHYVALGSNIEASGGLVAQTGYHKNDHFGSGTYVADPIAGTLGALTITSSLLDAIDSGKSRHIDISLQESLTTFMVDSILRYQINGTANPPRGNKSLTMSPNGVYQCAGNDSWLALSIANDTQWQALADIIGQPTFATQYKTFAERKANEVVIDEAITYWAKTLDHHQATILLQAAGIPSGPVLANWEIAADPHLYSRDFWMEGVHPEVGYQRWEGAPWKFSATPATMEKSAPLFNQHADEILRKFAGRSDEEIAKLREDGITLDKPSDIQLFVP